MKCLAIGTELITHADKIQIESFGEKHRLGNFPICITEEIKVYFFVAILVPVVKVVNIVIKIRLIENAR